jgi:potassium/hydrogen antiporter
MTTLILIVLSVLILISYVFELTSKRTKIPSVILFMCLGALANQVVQGMLLDFPNLNFLLPILGTVGLILIVLEGGLDLEINRSKKQILFQTSISALIPILVLTISIACLLSWLFDLTTYMALVNALPFAVISSSIAIPAAGGLQTEQKEFVTYESSLSDIFGVILFNFVLGNEIFSAVSIFHFFLDLMLMVAIALLATLILTWLIKRVDHHVKFIPIVVMTVLIYAIAKHFHLPALLFILILGLFLNNLVELQGVKAFKWLDTPRMHGEVSRFKELVGEMTFLIRSLFFILFGFLIPIDQVLCLETFPISVGIVVLVFVIRAIQLILLRLPLLPLLFVAPRGLITILLFLSIPIHLQLIPYGQSLVIQTILISLACMMIGLLMEPEPEEHWKIRQRDDFEL